MQGWASRHRAADPRRGELKNGWLNDKALTIAHSTPSAAQGAARLCQRVEEGLLLSTPSAEFEAGEVFEELGAVAFEVVVGEIPFVGAG